MFKICTAETHPLSNFTQILEQYLPQVARLENVLLLEKGFTSARTVFGRINWKQFCLHSI